MKWRSDSSTLRLILRAEAAIWPCSQISNFQTQIVHLGSFEALDFGRRPKPWPGAQVECTYLRGRNKFVWPRIGRRRRLAISLPRTNYTASLLLLSRTSWWTAARQSSMMTAKMKLRAELRSAADIELACQLRDSHNTGLQARYLFRSMQSCCAGSVCLSAI